MLTAWRIRVALTCSPLAFVVPMSTAHGQLVAVEEASLAPAIRPRYFGFAAELSGDGMRVIVGSEFGDRANVFVRSGTSWSEEGVLTSAGWVASDRYAYSVALTADGSRAIVGSPQPSGPGAGNARVFVRTGSTWTEEALLVATDGLPLDGFGFSVAISADGARAIIGAPGVDRVEDDEGCAYIFIRTGTTWTQEFRFAPVSVHRGRFGWAVAMGDDGNRAIVGGPGDIDRSLTRASGSARVLAWSGSTWSQEAALRSFDEASGDFFGDSVALSSDGTRALVGAPSYPVGASDPSARVFIRTGATWTEEAALREPSVTGGHFGESVALSADGRLALIGAPFRNPGGARLFERVGTSWSEAGVLGLPGVTVDARFGMSVSLSSDGTRALVGASREDGRAGTTRVYTLNLVGGSCGSDSDCALGFCVDSVCCNEECGGGAANDCLGCSSSLTGLPNGSCSPVLSALAITCRPVAGDCDLEERCDGTSRECPADATMPPRTVCRPAANACDVPELCGLATIECPPDAFGGDGAECGAELACIENGICMAGACVGDDICPSVDGGGTDAGGGDVDSGGGEVDSGTGSPDGSVAPGPTDSTGGCACSTSRPTQVPPVVALISAWIFGMWHRRRRGRCE